MRYDDEDLVGLALREAYPAVVSETAWPEVHRRIRRGRRLRRGAGIAVTALIVTAIVGFAREFGAEPGRNVVATELPASTAAAPIPSVDTPTTVPAARPAMIDVIGTDYREAQQRLTQLNVRVLLALDETQASEGTVTRTSPALGEPVIAEIVVYVAWSRPQSTPGVTPNGSPVRANNAFPPAGMLPGIASSEPDERCNRPGLAPGVPVRFLRGELVGCVTGGLEPGGVRLFVWLDQLDNANDVVATMPDLVGLTYAEAAKRLEELDPEILNARFGTAGTGTADSAKVLATTPAAGQPITRIGRVVLTLDNARS